MSKPAHGNSHNANGHRRRQLTTRIKATATHCALCDQPLQPNLKWPHDYSTVIDENLPRSRGGSPLDPENTSAMHNICNRFKSTMTLAEAKALLARGADIRKPLKKTQRKALANPNIGTWATDASTY